MLTLHIHEQQKEWAIKIVAGIVMFTFCYITMIHSAFHDIATLRQAIVDSQKRRELYREVQSLKESLDSSESVFATLTERSQLLGKISDIAGWTQLRIATLTPHTEPEGGFIKLRMEMDGQGNFFSLLKFLQAVEKMGAMIKVKEVSILRNLSAASDDGKDSLQIRLVFETFLKQRIKKNDA
ncbi:MAG: type 4a pilus biogenesis protein PilO [Candidatus Margulisiibacteriota bacterium]